MDYLDGRHVFQPLDPLDAPDETGRVEAFFVQVVEDDYRRSVRLEVSQTVAQGLHVGNRQTGIFEYQIEVRLEGGVWGNR